MPQRTTTSTLREALNQQSTSECFILLLSVDHDDLASPLYLTNCGADIVSNGQIYVYLPFQITMPGDLDDRISRVTLKIDNIDQRITEAARSVSSPLQVSLSIVLYSDPDTVEVGPLEFTLNSVGFDSFTVSGDLSYEDILNDRFPAHSFDSANFPGLFKQ